ncbi:MAG TPA: hypothetical protein VMI12_08780 [Puia sp.]|nr:hypothetical protein [Puia sp.]
MKLELHRRGYGSAIRIKHNPHVFLQAGVSKNAKVGKFDYLQLIGRG